MHNKDGKINSLISSIVDTFLPIQSMVVVTSPIGDQAPPALAEIITIPAKSIGILTSSPSTFRETYVDYNYVFSVEDVAIGNGLGSSETILLSKNSYNDAFSYTSEDGADGNGKSLARECYDCSEWNEAISSPGTL